MPPGLVGVREDVLTGGGDVGEGVGRSWYQLVRRPMEGLGLVRGGWLLVGDDCKRRNSSLRFLIFGWMYSSF